MSLRSSVTPVVSHVRLLRGEQFKVIWAVVLLVSVLVVNDLTSTDLSAENGFEHDDMLSNIPMSVASGVIWSVYEPVAVLDNEGGLPRRRTALDRAVPNAVGTASADRDGYSTVATQACSVLRRALAVAVVGSVRAKLAGGTVQTCSASGADGVRRHGFSANALSGGQLHPRLVRDHSEWSHSVVARLAAVDLSGADATRRGGELGVAAATRCDHVVEHT